MGVSVGSRRTPGSPGGGMTPQGRVMDTQWGGVCLCLYCYNKGNEKRIASSKGCNLMKALLLRDTTFSHLFQSF